MENKRFLARIGIVSLLFSLEACAPSETDMVKKGREVTTEIETTKQSMMGGYENKIELKKGDNVFGIGDEVVFSSMGMEDMQMKAVVNAVGTTKNLSEIQVVREDTLINNDIHDYHFVDRTKGDVVTGYIDENGNIVSEDGYEWEFLWVDMTMYNINNEYKNYFDTLWVPESLCTVQGLTAGDGFYSIAPIYFSEHPDLEKKQGTDYYHYDLSPGESRNMRVGFLINRKEEINTYYYVLNYNYDLQEKIKMVEINLGEGE